MLNTTYSPYWLILFGVIGLGYAYLLYSKKKTPWQAVWNKVLFVLRAVAVTIIAYLLLEPFINVQKTNSENSNIVFLWDDSESLGISPENSIAYFQAIKVLKQDLEEQKGVSIPIIGLSGNDLTNVDSIRNYRKESPLNDAIKNVSDKIDNRLISEVVLFSDGIYNKGISPDYYAFPFQLSTVGLGDTTQKQDIAIQQVRYNKVAYEGNQFPIEVDLVQNGFSGESVILILRRGSNQIAQKSIRFEGDEELKTVQFLVEAKSTGFQDYSLEIESLENEFNPNNNSKNVYINVVEGKKRVLLLAPYPHPDIKALSASIGQNDNYDFKMSIHGIDNKPIESIEDFDLAILFHLPNNSNVFIPEINKLQNAGTPLWFINGSNLNYRLHNEINRSVDLRTSNEKDEAFAYFSSKFDLFELNSEKTEIQGKLPPVFMPFADHQFHPLSKALMMKQVGNVKTQQPVFVFYNDDEVRQATLMIQNFRIWRMVEFLNTQAFDLFDDWVMKTIRYLTADNQKDRFKAFPVKESFADNENVKFQIEMYNEVYDRIYGVPVSLIIRNENDSILDFQFTPDRLKPDFEIGNLQGGVYAYVAKSIIQGKNFETSGQFVVDEFDIEKQNLQADFNLLRRLAQKNDGEFYKSGQIEDLRAYLASKDYPKVLSGKSEIIPIKQNFLPYILILLLLFSEWFIRRFFGSY
ncbi:hypothetical protein [Marivirga harenae]|uniref:hypothetical protein n=1 Tax=Marivirga harenae TaxID=2010992 RepID=UPI0026DF8D97|nr:hypothetical protein [Marivirga harenae]WKV12854.1 hypothetical protein Q3Y49_03305 [Marivirga harenae]|tara:strand:+ start:20913 stop:22988 length:2076 start_codon:yes stop_codon:yes gene_type:complete